MNQPTKLTLRLDQGLIASAKLFAHAHERSLSQLVADYFARLSDQTVSVASKPGELSSPQATIPGGAATIKQPSDLSPVTASLRGALKSKPAPKPKPKPQKTADPDKAAYRRHLEERHL
jgi:hypothetical protein